MTEFLRTHLSWIEKLAVDPDNSDVPLVVQVIRSTIQLLINLTNVREDQTYKICIEYWEQFTSRLRERLGNIFFTQFYNCSSKVNQHQSW